MTVLDELRHRLQAMARRVRSPILAPSFADTCWSSLVERAGRRPRRAAGGRELESQAAAVWLVQRGLPFERSHWSHFVAKVLFAEPLAGNTDSALARHPERVEELLRLWQAEVAAGQFSRLTWLHAFKSWMSVEADADEVDDDTRASHAMTGQFLRRAFRPVVEAPRADGRPRALPAWAGAIAASPEVLGQRVPVALREALVAGDRRPAEAFAEALQVQASSWLWTRLIRDVVTGFAQLDDDGWRGALERLQPLLEWDRVRPLRDRLVAIVVERTAAMAVPQAHPVVRDWVCSVAVWGPPPAEDLIARTPWRLVSAKARAIVRAWRAEHLLELFFRVAKRRNETRGDGDHGAIDTERFDFWRRYVGQVTAWRLVLGATSYDSAEEELVKIRKEEGSSLAELNYGDRDLDAFMLRIGPLQIVEFSRKGHAAFVYAGGAHSTPSMTIFRADLDDLKRKSRLFRIIHRGKWMPSAGDALREHRVDPDGVVRRAGQSLPVASSIDWEMAGRRAGAPPADVVPQRGQLGEDSIERLGELSQRLGGHFRKRPASGGRAVFQYFPEDEPDAAAREMLALLGFEPDVGGLYWQRRA